MDLKYFIKDSVKNKQKALNRFFYKDKRPFLYTKSLDDYFNNKNI